MVSNEAFFTSAYIALQVQLDRRAIGLILEVDSRLRRTKGKVPRDFKVMTRR